MADAPARPARPGRDAYPWFTSITTRWIDNDIYGHINNTVYYAYFDTVIGDFLVGKAGLDPWRDGIVGFAVETGCRYHAPLSWPDRVQAGLRVARLGTSSVRYEIGIFRNQDPLACADGHFVHVFVERATGRPSPIPGPIRNALTRLAAAAPA